MGNNNDKSTFFFQIILHRATLCRFEQLLLFLQFLLAWAWSAQLAVLGGILFTLANEKCYPLLKNLLHLLLQLTRNPGQCRFPLSHGLHTLKQPHIALWESVHERCVELQKYIVHSLTTTTFLVYPVGAWGRWGSSLSRSEERKKEREREREERVKLLWAQLHEEAPGWWGKTTFVSLIIHKTLRKYRRN